MELCRFLFVQVLHACDRFVTLYMYVFMHPIPKPSSDSTNPIETNPKKKNIPTLNANNLSKSLAYTVASISIQTPSLAQVYLTT